MFVHQHHLRNLLRPEHYTSEAQHRAELELLFRPSWHPVGVRSQLARPGDFFTFDLFGHPLILRNEGGQLCAFLNVCPHRHSMITQQPCGNAERLRCQYHGWEFNKDGGTGKIPDAKVFRPWDRDNSCLRTFCVATWGEVVFVSLVDDGPALEEFLAPVREHWSDGFGPPFRFVAEYHGDFACNWKIVLENALETYHVPELHKKTFKEMPPEEDCEHDLQPHYTAFAGAVRDDWATRRMNELVRRLGMPVTRKYRHVLLHPHVQFSRLDVYRMVQAVYPTGPRTCRYHNFLFSLRGTRTGPLRWVQAQFLRWIVLSTARKVFKEDGSIYEAVQRGVEASPFPGVLGTREERLYPFQEFVLHGCGAPVPPDPAEYTARA